MQPVIRNLDPDGNEKDPRWVYSRIEEEKGRIARALHDEVAQKLTVLSFEMALLEDGLNSPEATRLLGTKITTMRELVADLIKSVRKLESDLHPKVLDELGLVAALEWQNAAFQNEHGIPCAFTASPDDISLSPDFATKVFRLYQEILSCVARCSRPTRVEARVENPAGRLRLELRVHGRNLAARNSPGQMASGSAEVQQRLGWLGGQLHVKLASKTELSVTMEVPLPAQPA